jgi:hypothetical protein
MASGCRSIEFHFYGLPTNQQLNFYHFEKAAVWCPASTPHRSRIDLAPSLAATNKPIGVDSTWRLGLPASVYYWNQCFAMLLCA